MMFISSLFQDLVTEISWRCFFILLYCILDSISYSISCILLMSPFLLYRTLRALINSMETLMYWIHLFIRILSILLQELLMTHLTHRSSCNDEVNEPNLIIEWKDNYLICEDDIFTLIIWCFLWIGSLLRLIQVFKLIDLKIWSL